jgi:signal recognition particle GTPase
VASDFNLDDFARQVNLLRHAARRPDSFSHVLDYFRENRHATAARLERIIGAMTPEERQNPNRLGPSDWRRIASACGHEQQDIEQFLQQFGNLREGMRELAGLGLWQRLMVVLGWRRLPEAGEAEV